MKKILLIPVLLSTSVEAQSLTNMLWPPASVDGDYFGTNALAMDGDWLAVGTAKVPFPAASGCWRPNIVHVYRKSGLNWIEQAALRGAHDPCLDSADGFAHAVDISGARIAVADLTPPAHVVVFDRQPHGHWNQTVISAPNPATESAFGYTLALQGDSLVVGTFPGPQDAVYVFEQSGGVWKQTQRFPGTHATVLALDGDDLVLGAEDVFGVEERVEFFERLAGTWTLSATFTHPASSIALDGNTAAISASNALVDPDTVFLYQRASGWSLSQTITSSAELTPLALQGRPVRRRAQRVRADRQRARLPEGSRRLGAVHRSGVEFHGHPGCGHRLRPSADRRRR